MKELKNCNYKENNKYEILTEDGFKSFEGILKGIVDEYYKIEVEYSLTLTCTLEHKLITFDKKTKKANELKVGDVLYGNVSITNIKKIKENIEMYDLLEVEDTHTFYANGILSHQCLIVDECAHISEHLIDEFWKSVIPVISSSKQGKIFAVSTPNGVNNKFHELYSRAEAGESNWHYEQIKWNEVPGRGQKWKKEAIANIGGMENFQQEYNCQFLEKGESAIDSSAIETFRTTCTAPLYNMEDGHYKIWEDPKPNNIYVMGVDVCEGVGEAASVVQVLDITNLQDIRQVACYHNERLDPYHFATEVFKLTNHWGRPWVLVERNNCGGQVIDCLTKTHHYDKLVDYNPDTRKRFNMQGVYSHTNAKYKGVTNMRYWMNGLACVEVKDINLVQELETFVRHNNNTWKKANGKYTRDDRVMAMVWALFILQEEVTPRFYDVLDWDDNGKPLKIQPEYVEAPEYFKLDSYYLQDNAPIPIHFGFQDIDDTELMLQGYSIL